MNSTVFISCCLTLILGCNSSQRNDLPGPLQRLPPPQNSIPPFSGESAFQLLLRQTAFGPRNPGSTGYQQCLAFFQSEFARSADTVIIQRFAYRSYKSDGFLGNNVIARYNRFMKDRILLTAHWDTRPWADEDPLEANRMKPIPGANDGASGVAVLLELARIFKEHEVPLGVDIVLFDGEDVGKTGYTESFCQGSQYFSKNLPAGVTYRFAINLDMVGDKNLQIRREENSDAYAPILMDNVFSTAKLLGLQQFVDEKVSGIYDDHMPLNKVNIPAIDLIDFEYPDATNRYWHTLEDTPDKCSAESLEAVGTLLLHILYGQRTSY